VSTLTITLDERFFDIKNGEHFDNFVKIILPDFNEKGTRALQINVPLKQHKQSNKIKDAGFTMRKAIQLKKVNGKYYIHLIWEKETKLKDDGKAIGFDLGYKKLIATSDNQFIGEELNDLYQKIYNKEQNSKAYRRLLTHRDNLINYYVNQVNTDNLKEIVIEDLNNVKYKSEFDNKTNNLLSRWSYRKTINKIERICEVKGIKLVKVSPSYTSQTCSMCGAVHEESRSGENYKCIDCGFEIDADYNASINILRRGVYSPSNHQKAKC
jgi:putative transposase